jgi:hypothetical protein
MDSCEADNLQYVTMRSRHVTVLLPGYYTLKQALKCIALGSLHTGSIVSDESKLG